MDSDNDPVNDALIKFDKYCNFAKMKVHKRINYSAGFYGFGDCEDPGDDQTAIEIKTECLVNEPTPSGDYIHVEDPDFLEESKLAAVPESSRYLPPSDEEKTLWE